MVKKSSRAEKMAAQYADKLRIAGVRVPNPIIEHEKQTPEQLERLKKAAEKLRTFKDLI